jgi:hypothetical protein
MVGSANLSGYSNRECAINAVKILTKAHIPVGVVSNGCINKLNGYKAVAASDIGAFCDAALEKLFAYVQDGGRLYCSGLLGTRVAAFLGAEVKGVTDETETYIAPIQRYESIFGEFNTKYPMHTKYRQNLVAFGVDTEILATVTLPYTKPTERRFASIHSNPPGIATDSASVIYKKIGKGAVIWSAAPIENEARTAYTDAFIKLLRFLTDGEGLSLETDAPAAIEVVTMTRKDAALVSCVNLSTEFPDLRCHFTLKVKTGFAPASVTVLPDNTPVDFTYRDGFTSIGINDFSGFVMLSVRRK